MSMNNEFIETFREFVKLFAVVFDEDWDYTAASLLIGTFRIYREKTSLEIEYEILLEKAFGRCEKKEVDESITNQETFIYPNDEILDWVNRVRLLDAYRKIKKKLDCLRNHETRENVAVLEDVRLCSDFIKYFEIVFNEHWESTRFILGMKVFIDTSEEKKIEYEKAKANYQLMFGGCRKTTFLHPACNISDYWKDGGRLIEAYYKVYDK